MILYEFVIEEKTMEKSTRLSKIYIYKKKKNLVPPTELKEKES